MWRTRSLFVGDNGLVLLVPNAEGAESYTYAKGRSTNLEFVLYVLFLVLVWISFWNVFKLSLLSVFLFKFFCGLLLVSWAQFV